MNPDYWGELPVGSVAVNYTYWGASGVVYALILAQSGNVIQMLAYGQLDGQKGRPKFVPWMNGGNTDQLFDSDEWQVLYRPDWE